MPGRKTRAAEGGFTLIEALIAFAVLSTVLMIVSSSTVGGLEGLSRGARQQVALREAVSLLEGTGFAFPLEEGTTEGRTSDGRYSWMLEIAPRETEGQSVLRDAAGRTAAFYDVRATVSWRERTGVRSVTLASGRMGYTQR